MVVILVNQFQILYKEKLLMKTFLISFVSVMHLCTILVILLKSYLKSKLKLKFSLGKMLKLQNTKLSK